MNDDIKIAVIGLGYVGLPLAINFAKSFTLQDLMLANQEYQELKILKTIPMKLISQK